MPLFSALYQRVMRWAQHPRAPWFLGALSFAESSFFPIPPDVMLAPMVLARRERAWHYAALTTVASVLGGLAGYAIGMFAFSLLEPWLHASSYWSAYVEARSWFQQWGVWAILVAAFSPIPYKAFTIAAGTLVMPLGPFVLASAVGRGARFFLVASIMRWGGERMERILRQYIDRIGWALVLLTVAVYLSL